MWSAAATNGARGIWLPAHGSGSAHSVFTVDTNNNVTFYGSLSGNASSASSVAWGNVTGKPSTFAPSSHTHSYAGSPSAGGAANSANLLNINNRAPIKGNNQLEFLQFSGSSGNGWANYNPDGDWYHHLRFNHGNGNGYFVDLAFCFHSENNFVRRVVAGSDQGLKRLWTQGNSVTSAVWNDYAEYRTAETTKPGYVLIEKGDDTLIKSTKRL